MLKALFKTIPVTVLLVTSLPWANVVAAPLADFNGKPAKIEQYTGKGKWTIVMFWASDCLICNKEARDYDAFHMKHKDRDAVMLGVSLDGKANKKAAQGFIKEHDLHFPNLIGEAEDIAVFYHDSTGEHWAGTPTLLFYSPEGKLTVYQAGAVPVPLLEEFLKQQAAKK